MTEEVGHNMTYANHAIKSTLTYNVVQPAEFANQSAVHILTSSGMCL